MWEAYISDAIQFISSLDSQTVFYVWLASIAFAILPSSMMFPEPWQVEAVMDYTVDPFRVISLYNCIKSHKVPNYMA